MRAVPHDWFLTADERGNLDTDIDRRRGDGRAWTEGNAVEALVHGATYFRRLRHRRHPGRGRRTRGTASSSTPPPTRPSSPSSRRPTPWAR